MLIDFTELRRRTNPIHTVLFFGAGSSMPSGAPSAADLSVRLANEFGIDMSTPLDLAVLAKVIELKNGRRVLIDALTQIFTPLQPARGLLTLPDFDWAGLYTTNYDQLIERSYQLGHKALNVISSNFDFRGQSVTTDPNLYKLHGTIERDISLGHQSRIILTTTDYSLTSEYRETLYAKFIEQLYTNDAIVIGSSLADPDLRNILETAGRIKRAKGAPGRITILSYEGDENLALVYDAYGFDVCFGGIDEFFSEINRTQTSARSSARNTDSPLDVARDVHPSTLAVAEIRSQQTANLSRMFNGSAANFADIMRGWTFARAFADRLETQFADKSGKRIAYVLGAAGSGKTTGARKALTQLVDRGIDCWEHVSDFSLPFRSWIRIDNELRRRKHTGVLLIDDAHRQLHNVNMLVDSICNNDTPALKILMISSKPNWNPRLKTRAIFAEGEPYILGRLTDLEINSLLDILENDSEIAALVEGRFMGFNRMERQRRLAERCRSDMFVCMKNIFESESFDNIILREYAELSNDYQNVYRQVSGMEAGGIRVHRQFVIRAVGLQANQVSRYLEDLDGIIKERTVSRTQGIFAWQVRHSVIAEIVAKYKFSSEEDRFSLLEHAIDNLNPSYWIEAESMNQICDPQRGLGWIYDKRKQNILLRKMISLAPYQRVPRHRLITNLISLGDYDGANTEIRLFESELRLDGPVQRYKVRLLIEQARRTKGILDEDRVAMIRKAASLAEVGIKRFPDNKNLYRVYLEAGVAYLTYGRSWTIFDNAMEAARSAYDRILDPDLERTIRKFGIIGRYHDREL